jgi:hypothetical protein
VLLLCFVAALLLWFAADCCCCVLLWGVFWVLIMEPGLLVCNACGAGRSTQAHCGHTGRGTNRQQQQQQQQQLAQVSVAFDVTYRLSMSQG